jgi:hypothetical protein
VTIAIRPSSGRGMAEKVPVICPTSQEKVPATRWHDGQITCCALTVCQGNAVIERTGHPGNLG